VEAGLLRIWETLLDVRPIGVEDNFFELGGDSFLAAELFVHIAKVFGKNLPLATLLENATVAGLARRIVKAEDQERHPCLVPIQPHGTLPPFYCVHPLGGGVLQYKRLAECIGEDQQFWAFQGYDSVAAEWTDVGKMASRYVEELLAFQPRGPYYLGGWSFGGIVAYEMSCQLERLGRTVAFLGLIDPRRPNLNPRPYFHLPTLAATLANVPRYCWQKLTQESLPVVAGRQLEKLTSSWRSHSSISQPDERHELRSATAKARHKSQRNYVPQQYRGSMTLFRASLQPLFQWHEPEMGWRKLVLGDLRVIDVPGDHFTAIMGSQVEMLGRQLRECLIQAQKRSEPVRNREKQLVGV
jgi:aspartate racemase